MRRSTPLFITLAVLFLSASVHAQKDGRIWLDERLEVCKKTKAMGYLVVKPDERDYHIELYDLQDQLKMTGSSLDAEGRVWHGEFTFFHTNGERESQGSYFEGHKAGYWQRWSAQGQALAERSYAPFDADRMAYVFVDEMPSFIGGEKKFHEVLKQTLSHLVHESKTRLFEVGMLITERGEIEDLDIVSNMDASWETEAERVLSSMPDWNPGKKQGEQVRVWIRMPLD